MIILLLYQGEDSLGSSYNKGPKEQGPTTEAPKQVTKQRQPV